MNISALSWCVILLAAAAANLPFFNQQLFALIPLSRSSSYRKPLWLRLLELIALYFIVGALAHIAEAQIGNAFSQTWEFYAVTACLFLVLAYPGFVLRYLRKQHA